MLKCAWDGGTPRVIQISYPEGASFDMRIQESARLARLQKLRPESKAALLQLFGDDFDIGKRSHAFPADNTDSDTAPLGEGLWGHRREP